MVIVCGIGNILGVIYHKNKVMSKISGKSKISKWFLIKYDHLDPLNIKNTHTMRKGVIIKKSKTSAGFLDIIAKSNFENCHFEIHYIIGDSCFDSSNYCFEIGQFPCVREENEKNKELALKYKAIYNSLK